MPPVISRERKAPIIFIDGYPWYQVRTSPCEANCPAGNAIQRTISLIENNRFEEALENIKATNPFPGITGRVCFYPCETACNRGQYDQRIAFRALERAISDHAKKDKVRKPRKMPKSGKKVAIIGSGPGGMTCAYFLALLGHEITIFEASSVLGGIPTIIPKHRLPQAVVDREIREIVALGIQVRTNTMVGKDISLENIIAEHDACLIATGAWQSKVLDIPGADLATSGLYFLSQVNSGETPYIGERVVVIGSGGTALDCASTALRLGVKEVHIAALEACDKMLAIPEEIEQGKADGIIIHNSQAFTKILSDDGHITGIECLDIRSFEFDKYGTLHIDSVADSEHVLPADTIIFAVGQAPDPKFIKGVTGIKVTKRQTLEVNPITLATGRNGVFATGDVVTGSKSIVEAIGGGRRAAISIHRYLTNKNTEEQVGSICLDPDGNLMIETYRFKSEGAIPQRLVNYEDLANVDYFEKKPRVEMKCISFPESIQGFKELRKGYAKAEAIEESERCFHCGHCFQCKTCVEVCPEDVLAITDDGVQVTYPDECYFCGSCVMDCPCSAITMRIPAPMRLAPLRGNRP